MWLSSEVSEVFLWTEHLLRRIIFDIARVISGLEVSVVLKLLKFLKKLKYLE